MGDLTLDEPLLRSLKKESFMVLEQKNIVITGASRGLGKTIARECWQQGANLLLVARSKESLEASRDDLQNSPVRPKQTVHICVADLSKESASLTVVNKALTHWTDVHGLINNAAILGPIGKAWENDWKEWEATMRVNLYAPVELCRAFAPWMIQSGRGSIINLSGGGATGTRPNFSAYATSKTGLVRFTEILADELKGTGVRANSISPGTLATDMLKQIIDAGPVKVGADEYDRVLAYAKNDSSQREKAAQLCTFLLSDAAKDVTGRILAAIWDPWKELVQHADELMKSDIYTLRRILPGDRQKKWNEPAASGAPSDILRDTNKTSNCNAKTEITNIAVVGLWHLGTVTAACLAQSGHAVVGIDENVETIAGLKNGFSPVLEPGLNESVAAGISAGTLSFSTDFSKVAGAQLVWITFDTPVDDDDNADVESVYERVKQLFPHIHNDALVLISSQLPVGSVRLLEDAYKAAHPKGTVRFAYSPENLRLGKAIEVFTKPDRVVVGVRTEHDKELLTRIFGAYTNNIVWMSVEAAEVTKHAINAFLATSVTFINELASICEHVGADAREVEQGLKSESRIGPRAYLRAGGAFAGGTLARDVAFLVDIGKRESLPTDLFSAVRTGNAAHRNWPRRKLEDVLGCDLKGKRVAVLGLTYKPGTSTLRRSTAVEFCSWLHEKGATVSAYDPSAEALPEALQYIQRESNLIRALKDADAAVIGTEWSEFKTLAEADVVKAMRQPIVLDAGSFLEGNLSRDGLIQYFSVGRAKGKTV